MFLFKRNYSINVIQKTLFQISFIETYPRNLNIMSRWRHLSFQFHHSFMEAQLLCLINQWFVLVFGRKIAFSLHWTNIWGKMSFVGLRCWTFLVIVLFRNSIFFASLVCWFFWRCLNQQSVWFIEGFLPLLIWRYWITKRWWKWTRPTSLFGLSDVWELLKSFCSLHRIF